MKNVLRKILNHLESELICYQELSQLYDEQKEVLIKNKHEELQNIDSRFTALYNKINKYNYLRKQIIQSLEFSIVIQLLKILHFAKFNAQ